jgi:hypothetical protein
MPVSISSTKGCWQWQVTQTGSPVSGLPLPPNSWSLQVIAQRPLHTQNSTATQARMSGQQQPFHYRSDVTSKSHACCKHSWQRWDNKPPCSSSCSSNSGALTSQCCDRHDRCRHGSCSSDPAHPACQHTCSSTQADPHNRQLTHAAAEGQECQTAQ